MVLFQTLAVAGAAVLASSLAGVSAHAQSGNSARPVAVTPVGTNADPRDLPLWEVGMGLGAMRLPHYRGADQSRSWLLPLPYVVYRGDVFKADREGARAEFLKSSDWRFDFSLAAGAPTDSEDNRAREGMRDLAPTLEFGPSFVWTAARGPGWKLETRVPLRGAMTLERHPRVVGGVLSPNLNLDVEVSGWDVGVYVGPVFGTRRQNGYYYDVPDADVRADRAAYRSGSGYAGSQVVFGTSRRFGDLWVGAFGKVDHLGGAVFEDSPIVRRKTTVAFGVGVSWVFWKSHRPAQDVTR
jgi:outer membrane scaffolding protein for murein synthesis (MipA/OmpV family)